MLRRMNATHIPASSFYKIWFCSVKNSILSAHRRILSLNTFEFDECKSISCATRSRKCCSGKCRIPRPVNDKVFFNVVILICVGHEFVNSIEKSFSQAGQRTNINRTISYIFSSYRWSIDCRVHLLKRKAIEFKLMKLLIPATPHKECYCSPFSVAASSELILVLLSNSYLSWGQPQGPFLGKFRSLIGFVP